MKRKRIRKTTEESAPKRIRKRARKRIKQQEKVVCERTLTTKCWFKGSCPHRKPHYKTDGFHCDVDFCSAVGIRTGCVPVPKK